MNKTIAIVLALTGAMVVVLCCRPALSTGSAGGVLLVFLAGAFYQKAMKS